MKKLSLLIVGVFLLVACDATPGGNKAILPVVHDTENSESAEIETQEEEEIIEENTENQEVNVEVEMEEATTEESETQE